MLLSNYQENCPIFEHICDATNADSLFASPGHSELGKVLDLLSDDLDASFIRGVELQHPLSVQLWTGETVEEDKIHTRGKSMNRKQVNDH